MLRFLTFALAVALVAGQGMPQLYESMFGDNENLTKLMEKMNKHDEGCDENDSWKWGTPLVCRINNATGVMVERACPMDLQCNMGPATTQVNNESVTLYFCAMPGKYALYHACQILNVDTGEDVVGAQCPSFGGACSLGPIPIQSNNTNFLATYCDGIKNLDSIQNSTVAKACRIEDKEGNDYLRRVCPPGYHCTKGPLPGVYGALNVSVHLCKHAEKEYNRSLSETVKHFVVDKEVDPFVVLMVMRYLKDHDIEITAERVHDLVKEKIEAKHEEKEREEKEHAHKPDASIEEVMHRLEHRYLFNVEAELRQKIMEKREEDNEEKDSPASIMHVLHHLSLKVMEAKLKDRVEDKQEDKEHSLEDLVKGLMGRRQDEDSEEGKLKMLFKKIAFVKAFLGKVKEVKESSYSEEVKALKLVKVVHGLVEENEYLFEGEGVEACLKKVLKALSIMKDGFEGAEDVEDEDVKWVLYVAKQIMEHKQEEENEGEDERGLADIIKSVFEHKMENSEEAKLKMIMKKVAFVKAVKGKVEEIYENYDNEEVRLIKILKAVHEALEEYKDIMEGQSGEVKVMKVMKAVKYALNGFEGAEREDDEDIKWMVMIGKQLEERDQDEEENKLKKLFALLKGGRDEEEEMDEGGKLKKLMALLKLKSKMQGEDDEEENKLKKLFALLKGGRDEEEEMDEGGKLQKLMALLKLKSKMQGEEEEENSSVLMEILSSLKGLSERNQDEERDGAQILMFVKALMGNEGGESLQDIFHHLHHLHLLKKEAEMKQKQEQMAKEKGIEGKAEELLSYLHQVQRTNQRYGGGAGFGMPGGVMGNNGFW